MYKKIIVAAFSMSLGFGLCQKAIEHGFSENNESLNDVTISESVYFTQDKEVDTYYCDNFTLSEGGVIRIANESGIKNPKAVFFANKDFVMNGNIEAECIYVEIISETANINIENSAIEAKGLAFTAANELSITKSNIHLFKDPVIVTGRGAAEQADEDAKLFFNFHAKILNMQDSRLQIDGAIDATGTMIYSPVALKQKINALEVALASAGFTVDAISSRYISAIQQIPSLFSVFAQPSESELPQGTAAAAQADVPSAAPKYDSEFFQDLNERFASTRQEALLNLDSEFKRMKEQDPSQADIIKCQDDLLEEVNGSIFEVKLLSLY